MPTVSANGRFAVGVFLVAVLAAAFAVGFRFALGFALLQVAGAKDVVTAMQAAPLWLRVASPALGGLLGGCLGLVFARGPQGHGVGNVMEAVVLGRFNLSFRVTLLKSAASWLAIASGGSIGR